MTSQRSVVFAEPIRTAVGTFGGSLKDVPAPDLGAVAISAAVARAKLGPHEVETVVMGNVVQAGNKMNPARQAAVHAGLPVTIPALTVNRVCGSGAQAIVSAAQEIALGNIDAAVAGGMENMDQAPYLVARARWGYRMGDGQLYDSVLRDGLNDAFSDAPSGWHTEDLVEKYQVTREAQDRWAVRSQQRFAAAQAAGHFKSQIVPVEVPGKKGPTQFDKDEHNRADTTLEILARLKPAFRPNGTITAGNAPGLNDAAAAMVLAAESPDGERAAEIGLAWTCVDDDELLDEATRLAGRAADLPRELARQVKASLRETPRLASLDDAVALELDRQRWSLEQGFFAEQRAKAEARRRAP